MGLGKGTDRKVVGIIIVSKINHGIPDTNWSVKRELVTRYEMTVKGREDRWIYYRLANQ